MVRARLLLERILGDVDQHWAGTFRTSFAPYTFYEFMPTPIFVGNRPMPSNTGPDVLFKSDTHKVYAIFDVDATVSPGATDPDTARERARDILDGLKEVK